MSSAPSPTEVKLAPEAHTERLDLGNGSWVDVTRGWLAEPDALYNSLLENVAWRPSRLFRYDHWVEERRLGSFWQRGNPLPDPGLAPIHKALEKRYQVSFAGFGLIQYRDGRDGQGFHRDTDMRWLDDTLIAILTLGAQRPWYLQASAVEARPLPGTRGDARPLSQCGRSNRHGRALPGRLGALGSVPSARGGRRPGLAPMAPRPQDRTALPRGELQRSPQLLALISPSRIRVLGAAGSGKTTLARQIAERLDLPRLEIDAVFWLPDWKERERSETLRMVREFAEQTQLGDRGELLISYRRCLGRGHRPIRVARPAPLADLCGRGPQDDPAVALQREPLGNGQHRVVEQPLQVATVSTTWSSGRGGRSLATANGGDHWLRISPLVGFGSAVASRCPSSSPG